MITTVEKSVDVVSAEQKKMIAAYRNYCAKEVPADKSPMPFSQFEKEFVTIEQKKNIENRIDLSVDQIETLGLLGWTLLKHIPESGPNKGKEGTYLVNKEANVSGAGFLLLSKGKLENTAARMQVNLDAISVALGGK